MLMGLYVRGLSATCRKEVSGAFWLLFVFWLLLLMAGLAAIACSKQQHEEVADALDASHADAASNLDASSNSSFRDGGPPMRKLQAVTTRITGGLCSDCARTLGFAAPRWLQLEDSMGSEAFELADGEQREVLDIVEDTDFVREMDQPFQWACSEPDDLTVTIEVSWEGGLHQSARLSDGCFARCNQPEHPFMRLKALLFELKERYVRCWPNAYRSPEFCAVVPEPPPGQRMLCAVCVDDCGVPLPDGVPSSGDPELCLVACDEGSGPCFEPCRPSTSGGAPDLDGG